MGHSGFAQTRCVSPFSLPSVTMASVVNLQVLYSGQSRCFWLVGFSLRISTYLLRGTAALPSFGWPIGGADLYQLRLGCDGLLDVRFHLRGVAFRIGARIVLLPRCPRKENVLWPVRFGQSRQAPASGTSCASSFENGADASSNRMLCSIHC